LEFFSFLVKIKFYKKSNLGLIGSLSAACPGIVYDAGSSGTRVYIYEWDCRTSWTVPKFEFSKYYINYFKF